MDRNIRRLELGDKASIHCGLYSHWGTCTGFDQATGEPLIVHASKKHGKTVETSLSEFSENRKLMTHSHSGKFTRTETAKRAKSKIGQPYCALSQNCEHLCSWAATGIAKSPQITVGFLILGGYYLFAKKS